jgi:MinD-like ATPase involved in chromosome partitioning or flagellar assembly
MTTSQLLNAARSKTRLASIFRFPYVHLIAIDERFSGMEEDEREAVFAGWINISLHDLRSTLQPSLLTLRLLDTAEYGVEYGAEPQERGHHWLAALTDLELDGSRQRNAPPASDPRAVHFYGYKGGQGRSTMLALVATSLAGDGWRVLAIDSDLEAPSLDIVFGRSVRPLSGTLLGLAQGAATITPERVRVPSRGHGYVDLLACRPRRTEFDIDAAAFALRSALDSTLIEAAATRIRENAKEQGYDVILIDHRAGLSPITLPWMSALRGPVVVFARLDEQWQPATPFLRTILHQNPDNPGLFVSWKPDDEDAFSFRNRNAAQVDTHLGILADAIVDNAENPDDLSSAELEDHWIMVPYDSSFRQVRLPEATSLLPATSDAVGRIRRLVDLGATKTHAVAKKELTPSGATDTGDLIQTSVLRELLVPENSISYVLGRKGTGKTRLLRELASSNVGEPLIVDSTSGQGMGIPSPSPELTEAATSVAEEPDRLWWSLFFAASELNTTNTDELRAAFRRKLKSLDLVAATESIGAKRTRTRTFLIDSLETAFPASLMQRYLESLFRVLQMVDTDRRISPAIKFKLFLRTDLAERGFQNLEQQLYGRTKYLSWNTQLILNFVLSRIGAIEWYRREFPELGEQIDEERPRILQGEVSIERCENLLLVAFPERLRRNNLQTTTFLKTYFADSASDKADLSGGDRLRYYPRIFDRFLEVIARPQPTFASHQLDGDRKINQNLIFLAHEEAAKSYLNQLESELVYLIRLSDEHEENRAQIRALLNAFAGLKTPFLLEEQINAIAAKLQPADRASIRAAMESMKRVGMFEDRPDYEGQWRVGRLFKSSLRMKYVR